MNRNSFLLVAAVLFVLMSVGCSKNLDKYPVMGTENPDAKLVDAPSLAVSPEAKSGKQIKIILKYDREMPADKQFYRLFRMSSGTGQFFVEVKRGRFSESLSSMTVGNEYLVYGTFKHDLVAQRNFIYVE